MDLERRINVLIYLNKDWKAEYGGELELWDTEMKGKVVSAVPIFNRCVIFKHQLGQLSRQSGADRSPEEHHPEVDPLDYYYYYTSTWDRAKARAHHAVPGARRHRDKTDWKVGLRGTGRRSDAADDLPRASQAEASAG